MRQLRGNPRIRRRVVDAVDCKLTIDEAVAIRGDKATLAAYCAARAEQARALAQYGAMRHWTYEYRRAAMQCRLLGERVRSAPAASPATATRRDATVARLTPRPAASIPSTGEAA
jgi:hypothetical protein